MSWLRKINPSRSLYGRIFLWFWLATLLMLASSMWLVKQFTEEVEFKPLNAMQMQGLQTSQRRLKGALQRTAALGNPSIEKLQGILQSLGQRQQRQLLLLERKSKAFIYGFSRPILSDTGPLLALIEQPNPLSIRIGRAIFIGPSILKVGDSDYLLFERRPAPRGFFKQLRQTHPGILLGVALGISGLLCFLLAWSLLKPIKQLQLASQDMASGDLSRRVGTASKRNDEIGALGRDFNHMAEQVECLLLSQKRLLADISHELRSPLARLQLAIGIAQQQGDMQPSQGRDRQWQRIEKESQRMEQMIAQVLTLSRLEAGHSRPKHRKLDLAELLRDLQADAQFEAKALGKRVSLDCPAEISLQGDPELLLSALENILRNAVKYAEHQVKVRVQPCNKTISITISDDGPGLPEQAVDKIFSPFYRVSAARERDSGGVGLGLAIAHSAIHSHAGTIAAKNLEAGGLCISIELSQWT